MYMYIRVFSGFSKFIRFLAYYFRFCMVSRTICGFSQIHPDSFEFFRIIWYSLGVFLILPDSFLSCRNLIGFSGVFSCFSDSFVSSRNLAGLFLPNSPIFPRIFLILPDFHVFSRIYSGFSGFSPIRLDSYGFFQILSGSLRICQILTIPSRILSDCFEFSLFAYSLDFVGFSQIIIELSKMLKYSNLMFGFSRIVSNYFGFFQILSYSLQLFMYYFVIF